MKISKETSKYGEIIGYPFFTYPNVPTQEQLYNWIIGKYKLTIKIIENNLGIYSTVNNYDTIIYKSDNIYHNEEDCIEDGLLQTLKLIEQKKW